MTFCFAGYTIDVGRRELRLQEEVVHVEPQVFDVLVHLVLNRDRVVRRDDLLAAVCANGDRRCAAESRVGRPF